MSAFPEGIEIKIQGDLITVSGTMYRRFYHVLRMRPGQTSKFVDQHETLYIGQLEYIKKSEMIFKIISVMERKFLAKPTKRVNVVIGIPANEYLKEILQIAPQFDIAKLYFFPGDFSPRKINETEWNKRQKKYQQILAEGAIVAERFLTPQILFINSLGQFVKTLDQKDMSFFWGQTPNSYIPLSEEQPNDESMRASQTLSTKKSNLRNEMNLSQENYIIIGPEGGFSDSELKILHSLNGIPLQLGNNVMQTKVAFSALCGAVISMV